MAGFDTVIDYMAFSDRIIFDALKHFEGRDDVTVTEIAECARMPLRTATRAISRLEKSGQIERGGRGRRWGSSYDLKEPTP